MCILCILWTFCASTVVPIWWDEMRSSRLVRASIPKSQQSWVRSQHPLTQWIWGAADEAVLSSEPKKNPQLGIGENHWEVWWNNKEIRWNLKCKVPQRDKESKDKKDRQGQGRSEKVLASEITNIREAILTLSVCLWLTLMTSQRSTSYVVTKVDNLKNLWSSKAAMGDGAQRPVWR